MRSGVWLRGELLRQLLGGETHRRTEGWDSVFKLPHGGWTGEHRLMGLLEGWLGWWQLHRLSKIPHCSIH